MTDFETVIMIKNMARETVRRLSAAAKNSHEYRFDELSITAQKRAYADFIKAGNYDTFEGFKKMMYQASFSGDGKLIEL